MPSTSASTMLPSTSTLTSTTLVAPTASPTSSGSAGPGTPLKRMATCSAYPCLALPCTAQFVEETIRNWSTINECQFVLVFVHGADSVFAPDRLFRFRLPH
ncbi:hypothetical protein BC936DRAFT_139378 [Jimgerdemannia flammicorona]|uniref:Uncharacterized protein n=1 Tax=Jimgerdemannia flammicorona TaxID=994334 RepID=A0A433BA10_9FUNG|nr:hypothetical protein BC936DRAFT_139378 [Jimgerdemannia flammicorona]